MQIDDDVLELLALGVATIVASRDEELRPEIARGWGISVSPDRSEATLCIEAPRGSAMRSNLERNGRDRRHLQPADELPDDPAEGRGVRSARADAAAAGRRRAARRRVCVRGRAGRAADGGWTEPGRAGAGRRHWVRGLYDQTPGPKAGAAL